MMPDKLSPSAEMLIKKLFKTSETTGKDIYIPDINSKGNFLFEKGKYQ
jgi:hypothetical protein